MNVPLIAALVGAVIGPLLAYLASARKFSGRIGSTEAKKLWDVAEEMRREYRERCKVLEARIEKLEKSNSDLNRENVQLHEEISRLSSRLGGVSHA